MAVSERRKNVLSGKLNLCEKIIEKREAMLRVKNEKLRDFDENLFFARFKLTVYW